jgi:hypothetical protein
LRSEFEITASIEQRNELWMDVELPEDTDLDCPPRPGREHLPGGPIGDVRLEVRSGQFLSRWGLWVDGSGDRPTLRFSADIHGERPAEPLELVLRGSTEELLYAQVMSGSPLSLSAPADGLPFWSPFGPQLARIELRLIRGGTRVWQSHVATAMPALVRDCTGRAMLPLDDPAELPALVRSIAEQTAEARTRIVLRSILVPTAYPVLDAAGVEAIQCLPAEWFDEVALRLAHHPSLIAWSCDHPPAGGLSSCFGRPYWKCRMSKSE